MDRLTYRKPFGSRHLSRRQFSRLTVGAGATALSVPLVGAPSRAFASFAQSDNVSGTVTQWCFPLASSGEQTDDEKLWANLADGFTSQFPDVKIDVQVLPWANRNDKISTALAANANPDVVYLNDDFIPQYGGDGDLAPLSDTIAEDGDDFFENAQTNLSLDSVLYAMPALQEIAGTVYNADAFKMAGVSEYPTDWDEILAAGPAFRDAGIYVTTYNGALESSLNESFYPLLWQAGGEVLDADNARAAFNSPEGLDALNFVVTLFKEGFADQDEGVSGPPSGGGLALDGKVGLLLTEHPSGAVQYEQAWGTSALKVGAPLKRKIQTSYASTAGWAVFQNSKNLDAAKAWVKYLGSPEPMKTILEIGGYMPPRKSLQGMYKDDPLLSQFEPYAPMMRGGVHSRFARQIISTIAPYIQAAFLGKQSAEDALASAESDVNRLLERG